MWTCPFCGEKEPLEFQRGHIKVCEKWPRPQVVKETPGITMTVPQAFIVGVIKGIDEGWDL